MGDIDELGAEIGDGLFDVAGDLLGDDVDRVRDINHLGMTFQIAFAEDGLLFVEVGELRLEAGNGSVVGDVGNLEKVAPFLLHPRDLAQEIFDLDAFMTGLGQGGVDGAEAVADNVDAVIERDEVVLATVVLQAGFSHVGFILQFLGAAAEVVDGEFVFAPDILDQITHELLNEAVGDERGSGRVPVLRGDGDEVTVADGTNFRGGEKTGRSRQRTPGQGIFEVRGLQGLDVLGRERLRDHVANLAAAQSLDVGTEIVFRANRGIDHLLAGHDAFRALELHRGRGAVHGCFFCLEITID